ncbi:MAG: glycosyltransferase, partial [Huintestinicola sp.]
MKILIANVPFSGHINPTLPLAKELVKRGHHVSYILTNQWKDRIEETGAVFVPYKDDADYNIPFRNGKPKNFFKALKAWEYVYNTIMAVGKDYDLIIYEFFTFTAFSAAQSLNLKAVRLFSTFAVSRENIHSILVSKNKHISLLNNQFFAWTATKLICRNFKLTTPNILTEITDVPVELNIVFTSKEFQKDSISFDDRYAFVG